MTIQEFEKRIYGSVMTSINQKCISKIEDLEVTQRMILAMHECTIALNNYHFAEYITLMKKINSICSTPNKEISKMDFIKEQANFWKVDVDKLLSNIKKIFS